MGVSLRNRIWLVFLESAAAMSWQRFRNANSNATKHIRFSANRLGQFFSKFHNQRQLAADVIDRCVDSLAAIK
jgi:hypothetical protein